MQATAWLQRSHCEAPFSILPSRALQMPVSVQPQLVVPLLQGWQAGSTSLLQTAPEGGGSMLQCCDRLCWSRRGATCSPPPGAAGPACPRRAKVGTSRQEQTEA